MTTMIEGEADDFWSAIPMIYLSLFPLWSLCQIGPYYQGDFALPIGHKNRNGFEGLGFLRGTP